MTEIQGKSILVRVRVRIELARVRVIGTEFLSLCTAAFMPEVPAFNLNFG